MIIKKILLNNFTNFYGKHVLELQEGMNLIVGSGGSGKTNLAKAFRFAVLGYSDFPKCDLINFQHRQECLEGGEDSFCRVEIEMQRKGEDYLIQGELSLIGNKKIRQFLTVDSEIDNVITSKTFKFIYFDPSSAFERQCNNNLPRAVHMTQTICERLKLNLRLNIRMAFLDGVLPLLSEEHGKNLLNHIVSSGLEQTIIMEKLVLPSLEDFPLKIHHLDFDGDNLSAKFIG